MKKINSTIRFNRICLIIIACLCLLLPYVNAHTFHTSLTVLDFNSEQNTVEITMQLFTHDLAQVLETKHKKRINLENTPDIDKLILEYLKDNFVLNNSNGNSLDLKWVGKEIEIDKVFIYLETPIVGSLEGKKMKNSIFFESFNEQTNLVICKFDKKKADLLFKVGDKCKEIQVENK